MQTSKEVVKNAVEFNTPDRMPTTWRRTGGGDVGWLSWNQTGTGDNRLKNTFDEWGCGWERTDVPNMGQITYHPLENWDNYSSFKFPDPDNPEFFRGIEERANSCDESKYIFAGIFMLLFERLHGIRGFENLLEDFYLEREKIEELADRIVEFDLRIIENINRLCPNKIDALNFTDDWGTETALMVNPKLWNEFFKPRYKKIFDRCHEYGWHVWMHSCGRVNEIIEPLIEIGCNALNLLQPRALGIEEIGKQFAGRICFETTCDIQHTLPFKSPAEIEEEAQMLIKFWGTGKGGFVLGNYGDIAAIGTKPESIDIMFEAFQKNDRWKNRV
ncbi:MAG: hypothetical protein FWG34_11415 [Oscillospiraceae bacterium]|nr:hypothetical protein [Oscillospiraceae bacterium]